MSCKNLLHHFYQVKIRSKSGKTEQIQETSFQFKKFPIVSLILKIRKNVKTFTHGVDCQDPETHDRYCETKENTPVASLTHLRNKYSDVRGVGGSGEASQESCRQHHVQA